MQGWLFFAKPIQSESIRAKNYLHGNVFFFSIAECLRNQTLFRMNSILKFRLIPFIFVLFACTREIEYDPGVVEHQLVVNAYIQPNTMDTLLLSSTYTTASQGVTGARVVVTHQGDTVGCYIEKSKGLYCYQGEAFQENKDYQLEASHPQYPSISAQTTVPVVPEFWFGTFADSGTQVKKDPDEPIQVLLEFDDDEKTNNYYELTATSIIQYAIIVDTWEARDSIVTRSQSTRLNSQSPIIEITNHDLYYDFAQLNYDWETSYGVRQDRIIFSDKLFNGQKASIPIDLSSYNARYTKYIHLTLTSISEEYYQLLRSLATLSKSDNGVFPEALQVYSNIHNGQGIWGAKSSKTVTLDITELNLFNNE